MIGVKRMDKTWTDEFYREMDADKRLVSFVLKILGFGWYV